MNKRPKSREETPKEGSDSARSATAPQQYATALHKTQELSKHFFCNVGKSGETATRPAVQIKMLNINILREKSRSDSVQRIACIPELATS